MPDPFRLDTSDPLAAPGWHTPPAPAELFLSCDPFTRLATLADPEGQALRTWANPLDALAFLHPHLNSLQDPDARWLGFLNFDLAHLFESLPSLAHNDLRLPLFAFALVRPSALPPSAIRNPQSAIPPTPLATRNSQLATPPSNLPPPAFQHAVARVLDYIAAGDIFQANLAHRLTLETCDAPADIYARLLARTPARFGAYLPFPAHTHPDRVPFTLISNSPELFLRVASHPPTATNQHSGDLDHRGPTATDHHSSDLDRLDSSPPQHNARGLDHGHPPRRVITRPIKGTRPNLPGQADELLASPKDAAELAMIVDLHRNDLGRVCSTGSVRVTAPRTLESHPTVLHTVATVEGTLRPGITFPDLLRATFPPGSVTGVPKIRALQIIDELEPHRRNAYCGAIGCLTPGGGAHLNVAIRTMTVLRGKAHISVGGGVVADSDPDTEYEETLTKARALLAALEG